MNQKLARRYVEDGMATIPKPQLLLRLYERLLLDLERAEAAVDERRIEDGHNALVHAQDIVHELNLALDVEVWEGARALRSIYQHLTELLIEANTSKSVAPIRAGTALVVPLRDAWSEAFGATTPQPQGIG